MNKIFKFIILIMLSIIIILLSVITFKLITCDKENNTLPLLHTNHGEFISGENGDVGTFSYFGYIEYFAGYGGIRT